MTKYGIIQKLLERDENLVELLKTCYCNDKRAKRCYPLNIDKGSVFHKVLIQV